MSTFNYVLHVKCEIERKRRNYFTTTTRNGKAHSTRMHSSRMRTARSSSRPGGVSTRHPPGSRPHPEQACPPPVNRMTDRCKNITLPQTSFAGGNNREMGTLQLEVTFLYLKSSYLWFNWFCLLNWFYCYCKNRIMRNVVDT